MGGDQSDDQGTLSVSDPHARPAPEVLAALGSGAGGLTPDAARARLARCGANRLAEPPRRGPVARFLSQFNNVLIYVLIGAAAVTATLGHAVDTGVILAVVIVNAAVGFVQEGRAEQAMAGIRKLLAPRAAVLRGGERLTVPGEILVPGDVVLLEAGDRVPADLRLFRARGLSVQESILTGESAPVDKSADPVPADAALGDRRSMAHSGTLVTQGTGQGVVIATGDRTEIGRIGGLLSSVQETTTPLVRQMDGLARRLTGVILAVSALILGLGHAAGQRDFADLFMAVVGLAVAAVPEGLPAVITITLAIGAQAMARRSAIVRRLPAIEAIGSVSVICTDKTGTLTRNEMTVAAVVTTEGEFAVSGIGYDPQGFIDPPGGQLAELARASALCNDAGIRLRDGSWVAEGDPMEAALLVFARKAGVSEAETGGKWRRLDAIAFDARHRFMAVLHRGPDGEAIHAKGAPERILAMCAKSASRRGPEPLDADRWHAAAAALAARGMRVLAFARGDGQGDRLDHGHVRGGLTFLGLVGLIDPPRPEAVRAVAECRAAGIRVKMITGDHPGTAAAIAREVGIRNADDVLAGPAIDALDDQALAERVVETDVFARASPEHKLRLVGALQSRGLSVAMTGDGVNDAPALKRADVGIAMGLNGSEAAKEAAPLVLADDNFATIAAAVREGRTVQDNLRKVVSFELPTSAGEGLTIVAALLLGLALPVTAVQILWINLITGITLGLALAFEPTEPGTMARAPRRKDAPILSGELVWHVVLVSSLFLAAAFGMFAFAIRAGHPEPLAQTMTMNMLVVLEIFHLFFIRNLHGTSLTWGMIRGTRVIWSTILAVTAAQVAITYLPPLQAVFGTVAVPFREGLAIVATGMAFFVVLEVEKQIRLWLRARHGTTVVNR